MLPIAPLSVFVPLALLVVMIELASNVKGVTTAFSESVPALMIGLHAAQLSRNPPGALIVKEPVGVLTKLFNVIVLPGSVAYKEMLAPAVAAEIVVE